MIAAIQRLVSGRHIYDTSPGNDYYVAGVVISLSVVHGGPAPRFLATELYAALVSNPDSVDVTVTSLPECSWKPDLEAVSSLSVFSHAYLYVPVHF